jgi:hypothetical protein
VLLSISKPLALFWRSRSALSASAARFLAALSALILAWSAVGGLMISVIRIKYLARRSESLKNSANSYTVILSTGPVTNLAHDSPARSSQTFISEAREKTWKQH